MPIDTTSSQAHEGYSEPKTVNHYAEHRSRIADFEEQVKVLKQQIIAAMEQAKKSAALSQKVSSFEGQLSALMAKVVHLEECDLYMTEIIKAASQQLSCKLLGAPEYFC
jgi:predicted  nucleic acid-binding Zn-ribbon protein